MNFGQELNLIQILEVWNIFEITWKSKRNFILNPAHGPHLAHGLARFGQRHGQAVLHRPEPALDRPTHYRLPGGPWEATAQLLALSLARQLRAPSARRERERCHGGRGAEAGGGPAALAMPAVRHRAEATERMRWRWVLGINPSHARLLAWSCSGVVRLRA
jgi:hypothetical protein